MTLSHAVNYQCGLNPSETIIRHLSRARVTKCKVGVVALPTRRGHLQVWQSLLITHWSVDCELLKHEQSGERHCESVNVGTSQV